MASTRSGTIQGAVQAALDAAENGPFDRLASEGAWAPARTRVILALLALCYAGQVYGSRAAARQIARDPDFLRLAGEASPDICTLRRMRAEHRETLHRCLVAALRFVAEQKIALGVVTKVNGPQLDREASRRIVMAAFTDSLELDGERGAGSPVEYSILFATKPTQAH